MIKITVGISKEHIAVKCVGHANYNICGEDIVMFCNFHHSYKRFAIVWKNWHQTK